VLFFKVYKPQRTHVKNISAMAIMLPKKGPDFYI
jgi:hypothetical protein